jgi:hypothetical protein
MTGVEKLGPATTKPLDSSEAQYANSIARDFFQPMLDWIAEASEPGRDSIEPAKLGD